jgi:hypothetical protein
MSKKQQPAKPQKVNAKPRVSKARRRQQKGMCLGDRPVLEPNAGGVDVGAREMFVGVPPGRDKEPAPRRERNSSFFARRVEMPKATIHEDQLVSTSKHKVRLSWQVLRMESIAIALA